MRFPWLISRRKLIFNCLLEIFLIFIINKTIFSDYFAFEEDINNFSITFLPFWILISYIFGRYSYSFNIFKKNSFLLFINVFTKAFFVSILSLIFVFCIYLNIDLNNYNHFDKLILFYSFLNSLILVGLQFPLLYKFTINTNKKNIWLFVGSEKLESYIKSELSWSRRKIEIISRNIHSNLSDVDFNSIEGIFIDKFEQISDDLLDKLLKYKTRGTQVFSVEHWCENNLQRFPPEIISKKFLIRRNFKIPFNALEMRIKRMGDFLFSILLLILTSPILLIASILIYAEDRQTIIYKQKRVGINQKVFTIYKLRTMKLNSESGTPIWARKLDNRITNVGRLIRKCRIDELPQLICVIKGEMSLIGPRPERAEIDKELTAIIPFYNYRYLIRPGLSGWAQVNYPYGASVEDSKKKLSFDLFYLKNFSIWFDFLILFKTIRLVILRKGSEPI
tara:strand:- start:8871 stop:10217 length:1347 start_codon:yes stop_codon:yes gene_type:complete